MSVEKHNCLWTIELFEFTGEEIGRLKEESKQSPRYFYKILPEFCLHTETGTIKRTEDYLQWINSGAEKYILFNSFGGDTFLEEEIANDGLDDLFEGVDMRPWFDKLPKIKYEQWFKRAFNYCHLVVTVNYYYSHDFEYGWELDECVVEVVGYLDKNLQQRNLNDEIIQYSETKTDLRYADL